MKIQALRSIKFTIPNTSLKDLANLSLKEISLETFSYFPGQVWS